MVRAEVDEGFGHVVVGLYSRVGHLGLPEDLDAFWRARSQSCTYARGKVFRAECLTGANGEKAKVASHDVRLVPTACARPMAMAT